MMDADTAHDQQLVGDGNCPRSARSGVGARPSNEPIMSDVPRRRHTDWTSRCDRGLERHAEVTSCSGADARINGSSKNSGEEITVVGPAKDSETRRFGFGGGIRGHIDRGITAIDLPRRQPQYVGMPAQSGGDNNVVLPLPSSTDASVDDLREKDEQTTDTAGPVQDPGSGQLRPDGGIGGRTNGGVIAIDIPRRCCPYLRKPMQSGGDNDDFLPGSLLHGGGGGGEEGVVALGLSSSGNDADHVVDCPHTHRALGNVASANPTSCPKRVRYKK